ncbi:MAG TPA: alkaline phosphatase family protein [Clostridia bacterium]|nr:alkaline phosphatase family protein [Clostridia bacterium]
MRAKLPAAVFLLVLALGLCACGGGSSRDESVNVPVDPSAPLDVPQHSNVVVLVLENTNYADVVGNPSMPYMNGLIAQGGLATNYTANVHPSLPNYFVLTTGQTITNSNDYPGPANVDNVVRQLAAAGKTWKAYAESLPSVGYLGGDRYPYVKRHNPFVYFTDVIDNAANAARVVPFSQFASDLGGGLPNYAFVMPNNIHNGHDCPAGQFQCTQNEKLATVDGWLRQNIGPLVDSAQFKANGLLIVTYDEDAGSGGSNGGHIATVLVGPKVRPGFQSTTAYQHESVLKLTMNTLGVRQVPGGATTAPSMSEFFVP